MDRNCDLKGILFVTAVVVFLIPYNVITTEHTTRVTLSKNGSVIDETQLPTCLNVGTIKLLSYRYLCAPLGSACTAVKEKLSATAEIIVHEMCSLKETCFVSTFPPADLSDVGRTIVELKYTCLDQFETFVDICFNTSKTDDKTIHLIYTKKNEVLYEACQCNIKGEFALRLNDIRFKTAHSDKCSKATLTVHNQTYGCDEETDGYGSVFRRSIGEWLSDETVVVTSDSTNVGPEMIYISITPIEFKPIQLVCRHTPLIVATTTTQRVTEASQTENTTTTSSAGGDSTWRTSTVVIVCVGVGIPVVALVACLILAVRRWKQKQMIDLEEKDEKTKNKLISPPPTGESKEKPGIKESLYVRTRTTT